MATPFLPLRALQKTYETADGVIGIHLYLLDVTVEALVDTYDTVDDLPGLLPTTGSYDATTGIDAGDWPVVYDDDVDVMEVGLPGAAWASTDTYTLMFRWVVLARADGTILTTVDFGVAQTLDDELLKLWAPESADIPGSYPVLKWTKA